MRRLVCACVVRKPPKTGFLAVRPILCAVKYGRRHQTKVQSFMNVWSHGMINVMWNFAKIIFLWQTGKSQQLKQINLRDQWNLLSNKYIWALTCDFQQCGILTCVDSDQPVQLTIKLRNSKCCSTSSLTVIECSSDLQRLWSGCVYAQAGLSLCWLHIPHCWKSHVAAHFKQYSLFLQANPLYSYHGFSHIVKHYKNGIVHYIF